jgi:hypothetical protein
MSLPLPELGFKEANVSLSSVCLHFRSCLKDVLLQDSTAKGVASKLTVMRHTQDS